MAATGSSKRSYVLVLGCSLACTILLAWHFTNRSAEIRRQMRKLRSELEPIRFEVLSLELYRGQVAQAKDVLRSGNRENAIGRLEDAIELARMLRIIPLGKGDVPGEDEMLLISLYYQRALQGRVDDGMQEFWTYMVSAYPNFSTDSLDAWSRIFIKRYTGRSGAHEHLQEKAESLMENKAR